MSSSDRLQQKCILALIKTIMCKLAQDLANNLAQIYGQDLTHKFMYLSRDTFAKLVKF